MASIVKTLFRTALIGGLAVGTMTLIVGPHRMAAGVTQVRYHLVTWFDKNVDDPIIIRQQLKKLQAQYPERIREVRKSVAEVDCDIASLTRETEVAAKVVSMAETDLRTLAGLVDQAQVQLAADTSYGREVLVKFQGRNLTVDQAYARANRIKQAAVMYNDRKTHADRELTLLETQRKRLVDQLAKLESEYTGFQAQVWQIERQIASIERGEHLIKIMEDREAVIGNNDKFNINSLEQISARLNSVRAEHEAILESIEARNTDEDYYDVANGRVILENQGNPFDWSLDSEYPAPAVNEFPQAPLIIDSVPEHASSSGETMAWLSESGK